MTYKIFALRTAIYKTLFENNKFSWSISEEKIMSGNNNK